jgi:two-component system, OmpR family, phosphate regulon sensor histidine kinase PhoR
MWPALIFIVLSLLVIAESVWAERRLRRQRAQAKREFTVRLLEQQQQAYAHARAQQSALFDSMADGVALLDKDGRVQLVNDALRRLFDLEPGSGQGQTLLELLQVPDLVELAHRLQQEKATVGTELELTLGAWRCLEVTASAVRNTDGAYSGAIFVFHDVTQLKKLENTRREFVANVSHELRTPLSLIHGFVETLLDGAKDDPARTTRYLHTIQKHTDRLTYLIEDLLTISQLEGGHVTLNRAAVNLRDLTARVVEDLNARAVEKQVRIQNDVPGELSVAADADRLEQVFFNLVENAIKYGCVGGSVQVGAVAAADHVEVSVTDDGPGIPPEAQGRVFERFYRVDRARSRDTGGTGLGLAIVKHIVLAHGGQVGVASPPGRGARFHFTLPRREADVPEETVAPTLHNIS